MNSVVTADPLTLCRFVCGMGYCKHVYSRAGKYLQINLQKNRKLQRAFGACAAPWCATVCEILQIWLLMKL